jgi:phytanoyl-CoA dioxygenase PhyH
VDGMEIARVLSLEQGYLFVPQCVDREVAMNLREKVLEICARRGWMPPMLRGFGYDAEEYVALQSEAHALREFGVLRDARSTRHVIERLLGPRYQSQQGDVCRVFFPGAPEYATRAHQDQQFLQREEEVWSLWIPLGDCPLAMGPLAVWPGSHKMGLLPHDREDGCEAACSKAEWVSFDFACGDALLVHKLTAHRALPNASDHARVSVDFRFARTRDATNAP